MALNIFNIFGNTEIEQNSHLEEFLKNISIKTLESSALLIHLETWEASFNNGIHAESVFLDDKLGVCYILKRIPSNENTKFLKLGRPGFPYQEKENDFILEELFNVFTNELMRSLKSIKK